MAVGARRKLGAYELIEPIGRGGSAIVYRAREAGRGRDVAIKIIAGPQTDDPTFRARFRQEAQLVSQLHHPHILEVLDSGEIADTTATSSAFADRERVAYLVTEFMPGGSLADRIGARRTPRERCTLAVAVAEQIGAALDWAHDAGVLHRDVKPSNVLIGSDGRYVLGDFGLARVLQSDFSLHLTASGLVAGTPAYMSPEQAMGEPADGRTDVYGLGVVLFELLTGRVPFDAESPMAVMLAHVHQPPPPPCLLEAELPPELDVVLLRALAKQREDRYQRAGELAGALREAVVAAYGESAVATGAFPAVSAAGAPERVRLGGWDGSSRRAVAGDTHRPTRRAGQFGRITIAVAAMMLAGAVVMGSGVFVAFGPGRPRLAGWITRFIADSLPPGIDEALPRNDDRVRSGRPTIMVRFSRVMDMQSVQDAFHLISTLTHEEVPLDFTWEKQLLVAVPQTDLDPNSAYLLTIEPTAHDVDGRPLGGQLARRFSTLPLAEAPKLPNGAIAAPLLQAPTPTELRPSSAAGQTPSVPAPTRTPVTPPALAATPAGAPPTAPAIGPDQARVAGIVAEAGGTARPADELDSPGVEHGVATSASPTPLVASPAPPPPAVVAPPVQVTHTAEAQPSPGTADSTTTAFRPSPTAPPTTSPTPARSSAASPTAVGGAAATTAKPTVPGGATSPSGTATATQPTAVPAVATAIAFSTQVAPTQTARQAVTAPSSTSAATPGSTPASQATTSAS